MYAVVKLRYSLTVRAIPDRLRDASCGGAIKIFTFTIRFIDLELTREICALIRERAVALICSYCSSSGVFKLGSCYNVFQKIIHGITLHVVILTLKADHVAVIASGSWRLLFRSRKSAG